MDALARVKCLQLSMHSILHLAPVHWSWGHLPGSCMFFFLLFFCLLVTYGLQIKERKILLRRIKTRKGSWRKWRWTSAENQVAVGSMCTVVDSGMRVGLSQLWNLDWSGLPHSSRVPGWTLSLGYCMCGVSVHVLRMSLCKHMWEPVKGLTTLNCLLTKLYACCPAINDNCFPIQSVFLPRYPSVPRTASGSFLTRRKQLFEDED